MSKRLNDDDDVSAHECNDTTCFCKILARISSGSTLTLAIRHGRAAALPSTFVVTNGYLKFNDIVSMSRRQFRINVSLF